nr:hypothetical protein CFP56_21688 [Quercus suber]
MSDPSRLRLRLVTTITVTTLLPVLQRTVIWVRNRATERLLQAKVCQKEQDVWRRQRDSRTEWEEEFYKNESGGRSNALPKASVVLLNGNDEDMAAYRYRRCPAMIQIINQVSHSHTLSLPIVY